VVTCTTKITECSGKEQRLGKKWELSNFMAEHLFVVSRNVKLYCQTEIDQNVSLPSKCTVPNLILIVSFFMFFLKNIMNSHFLNPVSITQQTNHFLLMTVKTVTFYYLLSLTHW